MSVLLVKPITNLCNAIMKPSDLAALSEPCTLLLNGITHRLLYELKPRAPSPHKCVKCEAS